MSVRMDIGASVVVIDDDCIALMMAHNWAVNVQNRVIASIDGRQVMLHRCLMSPPDGMEVDHINGDPLDNRRINLRICTHAENMRNRKMHANNKTGVKGVYFDKTHREKPYRAQIVADGKKKRLGSFASAEEAGLAYGRAAIELHGEFARNYPHPHTMQ